MTICRAEVTDILTADDEALVIVEDSVIRLSPLSTMIWELLADPLTPEELADEMSRLIEPPPSAPMVGALSPIIDSLCEYGVLIRS